MQENYKVFLRVEWSDLEISLCEGGHVTSIQSYTHAGHLLKLINENYPIGIDQLAFHRDLIGYVYFASGSSGKFVLKLYRNFDTDNALRSIKIINYLENHQYPVVSILPTSKIMSMFERFYQGYRVEREISAGEIQAMFDFIAIWHYELTATITRCQGLDRLSRAFLDEQYEWLMNWKIMCERKGLPKG